MIKKRIFLFFACFFCFQVWAEDNSKIVGHLGEEANQKPIHLEHINLGLYLNAGRYLQVGQEPWIQSLMEVITYRLMDIEAVSRGVEYPESDLENFLFGSPMNAKLYSYYSEIFDAKIVREYFRIQRLAMMMQEVMAYELVEAYDKIPSEEELLNFYIENQKAAFTKAAMYGLAVIELDDPSEAELVESKLLEGSSFEEMAAAHSINFQSALEGGYLGQDITEAGIMSSAPFAANQILSTEVGSWVGPISVSPSLGKELFFFFKVLSFEAEKESPFEDERDFIMEILVNQKAEPLYSEWVRERLIVHNLRFDYSLFNTVKEDLGLPVDSEVPDSTEKIDGEGS